MQAKPLQRRTFLRGLGLGLALPGLEAMFPNMTAAMENSSSLAVTKTGAPLRSAYIYIPNGVNVYQWMPSGSGKTFELGESLRALAPHRNDIQIIKGLMHETAKPGDDGGGGHARAIASFLTGARPFKTGGTDIKLGVSADQVIAERIGHLTRLKSLELSCDTERKSGVCDSGYSCTYQYNMSWRSPTMPMTPESNPRSVYERLFGAGPSADRENSLAFRQADQRSILDLVRDDTRRLYQQLGRNDRQKMDEYFTSVREVEQRIEKAERFGAPPVPDMELPAGVPETYREHIDLMFDLLALSFETDSTRVASFILAHEGSNRSFKDIGVPEGHHTLSHHKEDAKTLDKIAAIDRFYSERFAHFLSKMKSKQDIDGRSLLDNSMIVFGGAISDGNKHHHEDLPVILAGKGGGDFETGKVIDLERKTPMTNLYVALMNQQGVAIDTFANSDGRIDLT
ncbi:DUF1552 domain-containing protein [Calycomorphotria hydatis]|uniref:DUF1552 domain-containing protein n=1 Tax=Calycomorphotria hydatis TaxID=2528027 RepID=A0A517TEA5_9PLAN|nr:DUF1552 domain-containing protein [Calycomorphotria hydatis]QDT66710.1 hypothetical protein V22_39810 [Calycomorphotria hydatis]